MTEKDNNDDFKGGLHIDVETISSGGHVQFAGRDSVINVNTGGDVSQSTQNTITVGGIQTTPQAREKMVERIEVVEEKVEAEPINEETKEEVRHYIAIIKKLMLSKQKPNLNKLISSVKSLAKVGPFTMGVLADLFGEPLATEIIKELGPSAIGFFKAFQSKFGA